MSTEDHGPTRIRFLYERDPGIRLETVHGVWGGINPHGEIEMNLYNESDVIPPATEQIIAPDGTLGHEIYNDETDVRNITRHIHTRILLNYDTARALHEWLEDRLAELDQGVMGDDSYGSPSGVEQ